MFLKNKVFFYFLVCSVFGTNFLLLLFSPNNYGFGNIYHAFLGMIMTFTGLVFWFLGFIALGRSFSLFPQPKSFVKKGIYSYFKHPIYFGISLTFLGIAIGKGSVISLLFTLFLTTPLNYFRAKKEEQLLRKIAK